MILKPSFVLSLALALPGVIPPAFAAPPPPPGSCVVPPSAIAHKLAADTFLPDPFTFFRDGSKVRTREQWACRREEINQLFQTMELGTLPPRPESLKGTFSNGTLTIEAKHLDKSISFAVTITAPTTGKAPFAAFIAMGGISIPVPSDMAIIRFNNNDLALQNDLTSRGVGKFYQLYGTNHSASAMMAWAWGVSRVIDMLETTPGITPHLDLKRLGVSGCSRNGKGALVAGAFDQRIALTIPQESGSGGAGCWRISDAMLASGIVTQTASEIVQENVWFTESFAQYVNEVPVLPFDHHMLAGLVAPRGLLAIDNTGIDWLGPESVWGCMKTATKVWEALGVPDGMGVSQVGNHNHCAFPASQQSDLDAFINKFLRGQNTNTSIIRTDGANGLGFVDSDWINWEVPKLR